MASIRSFYRGKETRSKNDENMENYYNALGYQAKRDDDYRGMHDYWQHAEFYKETKKSGKYDKK